MPKVGGSFNDTFSSCEAVENYFFEAAACEHFNAVVFGVACMYDERFFYFFAKFDDFFKIDFLRLDVFGVFCPMIVKSRFPDRRDVVFLFFDEFELFIDVKWDNLS